MMFLTPDELDRLIPEDLAEEGHGEGVSVERRGLLVAGAGALAASLLAPTRSAWAKGGRGTYPDVSIQKVVSQLLPKARKLIKDKEPNEEAYLFEVASLLTRLGKLPTGKIDDGARPYRLEAVKNSRPIVIYQIVMKPGAVIKLHDHRDYNGVIMGIEGSAECRNFDFVDAEIPAKGKPFRIREEASVTLRPGRVGTLARRRHNVHLVTAGPEGARLLDVFTFFSRSAGSSWINFDDSPVAGSDDIYEVTWA
jgi:predicted metal-dependent enzyme (double-stranded beta helix superfamily)